MRRLALSLLAILAAACAARARLEPEATERPQRVLLIVVDQLRADFIDRADMPNLRKLRERGASFDQAIVGHLTSKTVVSHAVVTRGVFPKRIGWGDDEFRDARGVLGTNASAIWISGALSLEQMQKLLPPDVPTIAKAFPAHPRNVSVGVKSYAANAMPGRDADVVVTMKRSKERPGFYEPAGFHVPEYVGVDRFIVDAKPKHGTEGNPYPLDGNRFVPGDDPAHLGGDIWTVDAAIAVMEREDWGAAFVSLGGVDRIGHMFGADADLAKPASPKVSVEQALATADAAIGKLLAHLEAEGLDDETVVIVTADHGGMFSANHRARWRPGESDGDWGYGTFANAEPALDPQPDMAGLIAVGGVQATSNDTALRVWTEPGTAKAGALIAHLKTMPGVVAVYRLEGDRYAAAHEDFSRLPAEERYFQEKHARALLQTMAAPESANLVALLDEKTGYGTLGDHGGTQSAVQRIPLLLAGPGVKKGRFSSAARLVDVAPTVWKIAGQKPPHQMDGVPLCAAIASGC